MLASDDVAQVSFVVFLFGQNFHACHQQVIVAQKLLKDETAERVAEALVDLGIQRDDFHWDVQALTSCCRQSKKTVLE